jgi:hypothetical protein
MFCNACLNTDHSRSSSKKCPLYNPRQNKTPPDKDHVKTDEKVYKIGFSSLCRRPYRKSILVKVSECVKKCTQIAFEASCLLNLHLHRLLENKLPLPDRLLDRTYLRKFFSAVKTSRQTLDDDIGTLGKSTLRAKVRIFRFPTESIATK